MPKWETRETVRITAHGEERITESVPIYSKRELNRMNRLKTKSNKLTSEISSNDGVTNSVKKGIFSVIFTNPYVIGITIVLAIVFIIYISQTVDNYLDDILFQYNSLTMKPENSKVGFDKKLFYITVDADGKQTITVGYRSELEKKQAEQAAQDADMSSTGSSVQLSATAEQVKQRLLNSSYSKKADCMAMIYDVCMAYNGDANMAIGYMVNCAHEGNYGLVQHGMTIPKWDGVNSCKSTASNPLIVSTRKNVEALEAIAVSGNDVGVGIVQWTYYTRLQGLCRHYKNVMGNSSTITTEQLAQAERNWFNEEVGAYFNDCNKLQNNCGFTAGSAQAWTYAVCVEYENPSNAEVKAVERANSAQTLINILGDLQ